MLRLLLLVLPFIIKPVSSAAQPQTYLQLTEEAYKECNEQAIEVVEELAQYHCRKVVNYDPSTTQYEPKDAMQQLLYLGEYAYRDYNFLGDILPRPAQLNPEEALLMMRACLLQDAAARFYRQEVEAKGLVNKNDCAEEVMQREFDVPMDEAEAYFESLDKSKISSLPEKRNYCLDSVLSSFAREWVIDGRAEEVPKSGIGILDYWNGDRYGVNILDLNDYDEGVEWLKIWIVLNNQTQAKVRGWMIVPSHDLSLPRIYVYYVARVSKSRR